LPKSVGKNVLPRSRGFCAFFGDAPRRSQDGSRASKSYRRPRGASSAIAKYGLDLRATYVLHAPRLLVLLFLGVVASCSPASQPAPSAAEQISSLIDAQISGGVVPGVAVAVTKDGQTIYSQAVGVAKIVSRSPMLLTTPQNIGSITKQFTAAAVLLLQQEGKLSIDDRLSKYVPEYRYADEITLRQMLNMISGISDDDPAIYGDHLAKPISRKKMMANLNKLPLIYRPGKHMVYTNTNYNLLGLIVERVSGESFRMFLQRHIFRPAGMTSSSTLEKPLPHMATGYFHEKPRQPFVRRPEMCEDFAFGTGNVISTVPDLLKWDAALLSGRIIDRASLQTMFTVPGDGRIRTIYEKNENFPVLKYINDGGPTVYAMGWMRPNPYTRWHGGHTFLFESANVIFSDGYTIAIIGNVRDDGFFEPENLAARIHDILNPALKIGALTIVLRPARNGDDEQSPP
jgi:CubicO group peptidase (beta-lactamase class C family)